MTKELCQRAFPLPVAFVHMLRPFLIASLIEREEITRSYLSQRTDCRSWQLTEEKKRKEKKRITNVPSTNRRRKNVLTNVQRRSCLFVYLFSSLEFYSLRQPVRCFFIFQQKKIFIEKKILFSAKIIFIELSLGDICQWKRKWDVQLFIGRWSDILRTLEHRDR